MYVSLSTRQQAAKFPELWGWEEWKLGHTGRE